VRLPPWDSWRAAFEICIEPAGIYGRDLDDWLQAERELQEKDKNNEKALKKESDLHMETNFFETR
jgi:hypothetical protein